MSRKPLALAPDVEKQLNREIEEAWHLMQISRGLTAGFWTEVQRAIEREYRLRALLRIRRAARQAAKAAVMAGLLLATCLVAPRAHAAEPWQESDVHQALEGSPAVIECVVRLESSYQPYAIGSSGELGVAQLLPTENGGGQMAEYLYGDWVTVDPAYRSAFDPFLSVRYLNFYLETRGNLAPWATWWLCR